MQITKENIRDVLIENGFVYSESDTLFHKEIPRIKIRIKKDTYDVYFSSGLSVFPEWSDERLETHNFDEFMAFLTKRIDLKPVEEFNFREYLLQKGFYPCGNNLWYDFVSIWVYPEFFMIYVLKSKRKQYKLTKNNADKLIEIVEINTNKLTELDHFLEEHK